MSSSMLTSLGSLSEVGSKGRMEEDDHEFRDAVISQLTANGVLDRMKAELRSSVLMALQEKSGEITKRASSNPHLQTLLSTSEGRILCRLVHEFLLTLRLDLTAAVYEPEVMLEHCTKSDHDEIRYELMEELGMTVLDDKNKEDAQPLLLHILRKSKVALLRSETPTLTDRSEPIEGDSEPKEEESEGSRHEDNISSTANSGLDEKKRSSQLTMEPKDLEGSDLNKMATVMSPKSMMNKSTKSTGASEASKMSSQLKMEKMEPKDLEGSDLNKMATVMSPKSMMTKSTKSTGASEASKMSSLNDLPPLLNSPKSSKIISNKNSAKTLLQFDSETKLDFQLGPITQQATKQSSALTSSSSVSTEIEEDLGSLLNTSDDAMQPEELTKDASANEEDSFKADYFERL